MKAEQAPQPAAVADGDGAMHIRQRRFAALPPPAIHSLRRLIQHDASLANPVVSREWQKKSVCQCKCERFARTPGEVRTERSSPEAP